jgi:hypothetical protein
LFSPTIRDGFHESISRFGVKIDNGLEKPNQGLKKAEKVKNSDQTSGGSYTLTTARGARWAGAFAHTPRFSAQNYGGDVDLRERCVL